MVRIVIESLYYYYLRVQVDTTVSAFGNCILKRFITPSNENAF